MKYALILIALVTLLAITARKVPTVEQPHGAAAVHREVYEPQTTANGTPLLSHRSAW